MESHRKILITGSNGFVGANLYQYLRLHHPEVEVWCYDRVYGQDICNKEQIDDAVKGKDLVINLAAYSHVDNSLKDPEPFMTNNFYGAFCVLEACKKNKVKMIQMSTSEVYGSMAEGYSIQDESHPLNPQSPYAGAKCGADRLCHSYFKTYDQDVVIVRSFNIMGPYQACEKAIPVFIRKAAEGKPIPVYGNGGASRDWVFVRDTVEGIWAARNLPAGEVINLATAKTYNLIELVELVKKAVGRHDINTVHVTEVADRPGHVECLIGSYEKAKRLLGWEPKVQLDEAIQITADWYFANGWIAPPPYYSTPKSDKWPRSM